MRAAWLAVALLVVVPASSALAGGPKLEYGGFVIRHLLLAVLLGVLAACGGGGGGEPMLEQSILVENRSNGKRSRIIERERLHQRHRRRDVDHDRPGWEGEADLRRRS